MSIRQIVLDTETTGLEPQDGHRIIEIGCVEIVNRRLTGNHYHQYLQPDREIDAGAVEVHGITTEFLRDKPRFADIVDDFRAFVSGAELIIHNAPFDVGFLNHEFRLLDPQHPAIQDICTITDTLAMARRMHPGQKNSLDALCKRYSIDNSQRTLHGALLDAEILADLFLTMTGGQVSLSLAETEIEKTSASVLQRQLNSAALRVVRASNRELEEHEQILEMLRKSSDGQCVWDLLKQNH